MNDPKVLKKHLDRLETALLKLKELDDAVFEQAKQQSLRLDFVRVWKLAPHSKKDKPMPPICVYGAYIAAGRAGAVAKLEKDINFTVRNIERLEGRK